MTDQQILLATIAVSWTFGVFMSGLCAGIWWTDRKNGEPDRVVAVFRAATLWTGALVICFHAPFFWSAFL